MIDDTLYDAFGQRQISTMFTQLNQYRVVLEVEPEFQQGPAALRRHLRRSGPTAAQVPLSAVTRVDRDDGAARRSTTRGSSRRSRSRSTWRRASRSARRSRRSSEATRELGLPPAIHGSFQGTAQAFQASLANEPLLILAALVTVYIVLGVLYESYIHPDHDPLHAAVGRRRRAAGAADLPAPSSA